jgi:hypothetical protein
MPTPHILCTVGHLTWVGAPGNWIGRAHMTLWCADGDGLLQLAECRRGFYLFGEVAPSSGQPIIRIRAESLTAALRIASDYMRRACPELFDHLSEVA